MELGNSMLDPSNWMLQAPGASEASLNLSAVRESLSGRNDLSVNLQWDWLSAGGFSASRRSFWSVAVSEHIQSNLELPEDLLLLPFTGNANASLSGSGALDFSSLSFQFSHRREYAGTWQFQWNEKLSSGVRLAYLQGLSFAGTRDNTTQWAVNPDTYAWTVQGGLGLDVAGLPDADGEGSIEATDYLNAKGNRGVAADFALQFKPSDRWTGFCPSLERRTTRLEHTYSKLEHFGYHDGVFRRVCRECGFIGFLASRFFGKLVGESR